jgi:hypothetical protein
MFLKSFLLIGFKMSFSSGVSFNDHKVLSNAYESHFDIFALLDRNATELANEVAIIYEIEQKILNDEDKHINLEKCPDAYGSNGAEHFVAKIKSLIKNHRSAKHEFYESFLPNFASKDQVAYYLAQETLQDPRFDDFIASLQIGLPIHVKMELAQNYWDEMGNGVYSKVHTVMFDKVLEEIGNTKEFSIRCRSLGGLLCGNLSALLALRKNLIFRAIGYFSTIEYLFPKRCLSLMAAWKRLELNDSVMEYHREHVSIDAKHAAGFFKNVIQVLVEINPACAKEIYWGVCVRLNSSDRHMDEMLNKFLINDLPQTTVIHLREDSLV